MTRLGSRDDNQPLRPLMQDPWTDGQTLIRHLGDRQTFRMTPDLTVGEACLAVLNERWNLGFKDSGRFASDMGSTLVVPRGDPETFRAACFAAVRKNRFGTPQPK